MRALDDVAVALQPWFAARLETDAATITGLKRHAEGWSWQTYTMDVSWRDASGATRKEGFAVRREPEDGLLAPYDTVQQYRLHRAVVEHSRVPMPELHWLEEDPAVLGMPFYVMERMEGVVPVQWRGRDPEIFPDDDARRSIGLDFVDVLAQIHAIGIEEADLGFLRTPASSDDAALAQIDHWESTYDEAVLVEVPLIRMCLSWLRDNLATSGRVTLVHGDYRIGNFMLSADRRINAVFDWELAHLGDPVFDIAWSGMPLFRGRSPLMSQLLSRDEFLARYEQRTGFTIEPDVYRFWTVFGHLRASVPHVSATRAFAEGRATDVRLAAMGHQNLYILKQLATELGLEATPPPAKPDRPQRGSGAMQNSIEGVVTGIGEALAGEVVPALDDPYAIAQVRASIELLNNLGTRVVWDPAAILETIGRIRSVLAKIDDVPAAATAVATRPLPAATDATGLTAAESEHRAVLAVVHQELAARGDEAGLALIAEFATSDLGRELGLLRSGMYRRGASS